MFKQCFKCDQWKLLEHFHNDKNRKDGKYPNCKECHYKYVRNRYHNEPGVREAHLLKNKTLRITSQNFREDAKERSRKFYSSINGRARTLLKSAKQSPSGKLLGCTVTLDHIMKGIEAGICPVTGIQFELGYEHQFLTNRKKNPYAPSLDRINSAKGYTNENTRIVIWQYNMAKGETTDAEMLSLCRAVIGNSMR